MEHTITKNNGGQIKFEQFGNTDMFIARTYANLKTAQALVQERGLVLTNYQDMFLRMDKHPRLKEMLKDTWFYVKGTGPSKTGHYNFNDNFENTGDLTPGKGENTERNVFVIKSNHIYPLSIEVYGDAFTRNFDRRYILESQHTPDRIAPVIVAIRNQEYKTPKIKLSPLKNGVSLRGISAEQLTELHQKADLQLSKLGDTLGTDNISDIKTFIDIFRKEK